MINVPTKTRIKKSFSESSTRTVSASSGASSYLLTRAKSGVCLKRTDRRQVAGREQLLVTSLLLCDSAAFREYCSADTLARSDPFAADLLERAFHELVD